MKRFLALTLVLLFPSALFASKLYFPQVVFGGGYSTTIVLVNTGAVPLNSSVLIHHQHGQVGLIQSLANQLTANLAPSAAALTQTLNGITGTSVQDVFLRAQLTQALNQLANLASGTAPLAQQASVIDNQMAALQIQIGTGVPTQAQQQEMENLTSNLANLSNQINADIVLLNSLGLQVPGGMPIQPLVMTSTSADVPAGGSTQITLSANGPVSIAWAEIDTGTASVQGVANFELRNAGVLITSASLPAVDPSNSFTLPVEVAGSSTTGIAVANVNVTTPVMVRFRLLKEDGTFFAAVNDARLNPLVAGYQSAGFVTDLFPQLAGTTFRGTLLIEPTGGPPPDSLIATAMAFKEDELAPLSIAPVSGSTNTAGNIYFPQVVFGGGYSTSFTFVNTGSSAVSSQLSFYDPKGTARADLAVSINVPAGGSTRVTLPNNGSLTVVWAEVPSVSGALKGLATFDLRAGNGTLSTMGGEPAIVPADRFILPVDINSTDATGVAIANVANANVNVRLRLLHADGSQSAIANDVRLNPLGSRSQISDLVTTLFPDVSGPFKGTLVIESTAGSPSSALVAMAANLKLRGSSNAPIGKPALLTALPRDLSGAERKIVDAADNFSFALWNTVNPAQRGLNVFISPLSASFVLAMTQNGAANKTLDEMRAALQLNGLSEQEINEGYRSLIALLTGIDPTVTMKIADSIWYQNRFPFLPGFINAGAQYFDAEIRGLDFSDKAAALNAINSWVDAKTNHKIPTILSDIDASTVMVLINALYFNGSWRDSFAPAETRTDTFTSYSGAKQSMSLMRRRALMSYNESSTWQAVDLPYGNGAYSMTVVLPRAGADVETVAASFNNASWQGLISGMQSVDVDLYLPKLKLSYERTLTNDLQALGMILPFTSSADFTRMSPGPVSLSFVKQKTFVDINEEGTEAAAVTVVGVVAVCACPPINQPKLMRVDRPYIFVIRERLSGTILFMGKITQMP